MQIYEIATVTNVIHVQSVQISTKNDLESWVLIQKEINKFPPENLIQRNYLKLQFAEAHTNVLSDYQ